MTEKLIIEKINHTALITINNPPANTWDHESLAALAEVVEGLNADKNIYSLVIHGSGEKFFSAGADLKIFADVSPEESQVMADLFGKAFETLSTFRGVSIAAINGYAMGGGLEVALACDLRIAEEQAQLALPEAKVGLLPCAGGTQNLTRLAGEAWAKRIILCGERISAQKAFELNIVEEVVSKGGAKDAALKLAEKAQEQSPLAVQYCKELIQMTRETSHNKSLVKEREFFVELFKTKDQKEGVQAFLEKRKAVWTNS